MVFFFFFIVGVHGVKRLRDHARSRFAIGTYVSVGCEAGGELEASV